MPRVSRSKTKGEENSVFQMIVGVAFVALLAGINLFLIEPSQAPSTSATATVSDSVDNALSASPELSIVPEAAGAKLVDIDPNDPLPQCDFKTNVKNVIYGQPVKFSWDCVAADECSLDGVGSVPVVKKDGVEISPKRSAKYQLVCSNEEGKRAFDADIGVFEFSLRELDVSR